MVAKLVHYPVGCGDMTLIELESGRKLLVDVNIRGAADDSDDDTPDVAAMLRQRLPRDSEGRLYVDAMLLSHPDEDHCRGLQKHFHLGSPYTWSKGADKILIREMWSSPIVFRRASKELVLCDDARAWAAEARRRVRFFREIGHLVGSGDRIQILGRDEDGKTDDLGAILVEIDGLVVKMDGVIDGSIQGRLLGPLPPSADQEEEDTLAKNRSSTVIRFSITGGMRPDACLFLTGGDAEVAIWERMWDRHRYRDWLDYDILLSPHHCSWHSLSWDSWSELREQAKVSETARSALSQTRPGARIVASSGAIRDDDNDPPCIRAKREYQEIVNHARGTIHCVGEPESDPQVLEWEIDGNGPRPKARTVSARYVIGAGAVGAAPLPHG